MRTAHEPLSALQVFERVRTRMTGDARFTVAGVNSALYRLLTDRKIVRSEKRTSFGQFGCTYQWIQPPELAALDAVQLRATKAEIGRLGGWKKAANARRHEAASC